VRLNELSLPTLKRQLRGSGIALETGPVLTRLRSPFDHLADGLATLYGEYTLGDPDGFCDFDCEIGSPGGLRRWLAPQAVFRIQGSTPFLPLARHQAVAMMEWGLNWCVSSHCHQYLIVHAAVIAHGERAVILPAPPGSGKSTLCAALVRRGWRLLSDELALIDMASGDLVALPRPVSLKNQSIGVIQAFAPEAVFGPVTHDTAKGTVAHMRAPTDSVARAHERARMSWLVFPKYQAQSAVQIDPLSNGAAFMALAQNSFNYHVHGSRGFDMLTGLVELAQCLRFQYSNLDEAVDYFAGLAASS